MSIMSALPDDQTGRTERVARRLVRDLISGAEEAQGTVSLLTDEQAGALAAFGADVSAPLTATEMLASAPHRAGLLAKTQLVVSGLSVESVAEHLGVTVETVRGRIEAGTLATISDPLDGSSLIPSFQLTEDGELPHLQALLQRGRGTLTPGAIQGIMTSSQDETDGMSPVEWLKTGGDPARVAIVLAG